MVRNKTNYTSIMASTDDSFALNSCASLYFFVAGFFLSPFRFHCICGYKYQCNHHPYALIMSYWQYFWSPFPIYTRRSGPVFTMINVAIYFILNFLNVPLLYSVFVLPLSYLAFLSILFFSLCSFQSQQQNRLRIGRSNRYYIGGYYVPIVKVRQNMMSL